MLSLVSPVTTPWHGLPAGAKLGGLCLFTLLLFAAPGPWALLAAAGMVALAWLWGGRIFAAEGLRALRPLLPFVAVIAVWHLWTGQLREGAAILLRLVAAVGAANLVTMTTRLDDMRAVVERLAAPLGALGVNPRLPALAVALVLRFVPVMGARLGRLREAWRARSARPAGWRLALPATLGALDEAEQVAEALRARGGAG